MESSHTVALFERWIGGDRAALDEILAHLYRDIRVIAARQLRSERYATLRPTELVHEVYLRMVGLREPNWRDRVHFLAMAARVTRRVLVEEARRRRAEKRVGGTPVTLSDENLGGCEAGFDALDVEAVLGELQSFDDIAAEVVSLRVFGGLSIEETAQALQVSVSTANRRWVAGKAWLTDTLAPGP